MRLKKKIPLIDQHNKNGFWGGKFGGSFIPETLKKPVDDLTKLYSKLRKDKKFLEERDYFFKDYIGAPTPFIKLENKYMLYASILLVSLQTKLMVVIKYLIKLWKYDNNEFINSLEWESDKKVELFISEVSKSLPSGIRATIEEIC